MEFAKIVLKRRLFPLASATKANIFYNIMQASVKGNPKPEPKKKAAKKNEANI